MADGARIMYETRNPTTRNLRNEKRNLFYLRQARGTQGLVLCRKNAAIVRFLYIVIIYIVITIYLYISESKNKLLDYTGGIHMERPARIEEYDRVTYLESRVKELEKRCHELAIRIGAI